MKRCRFELTNAFIEFAESEVDQTIPQRFQKQVRLRPNEIAIKSENSTLTYSQLHHASNRLARVLRSDSHETRVPVAILLEHDSTMVMAILAALKAGLFYVPLAPQTPFERNRWILTDSGAHIVLTNDKSVSAAAELAREGQQLVNVDDLSDGLSTDDLDPLNASDDLAYILYTSGSTGHPKGVMQTHRNVLHHIMKYTNGAHIAQADRHTFLNHCTFAGSITDLFGTLLNGAALFPYDLKEEGLTRLADWLTQEEITVYHSVPTVFRHFTAGLSERAAFPKIRLIKLGGETVLRRDVEIYRKHFSEDCVLHVALGATEMNVMRQYFMDQRTEFGGNIVPVGYPVKDTEVLLLDEDGKVVNSDQTGEIVIKSRYLSPGYWRRPEVTRASFSIDARQPDESIYRTGDLGFMQPDGCLVHVGRKDFRVKIRGHSIEPAEVEIALLEMDGVRSAAVVAREDHSGEQQLIAYLVVGNCGPTQTSLRHQLSQKLPDYMVPSRFEILDAMPLTSSWKIDRKSLPVPSFDTRFSEVVPPRTPIEAAVVEIWIELIGVKQVSVDDNFFSLGGHSLHATRFVARVHERFAVDIPLRVFFESPTVSAIARIITSTMLLQSSDHELKNSF